MCVVNILCTFHIFMYGYVTCGIVVSEFVFQSRNYVHPWKRYEPPYSYGGARGGMVIVVGNRHGDTSSNPRQELSHFRIALIPLGKV